MVELQLLEDVPTMLARFDDRILDLGDVDVRRRVSVTLRNECKLPEYGEMSKSCFVDDEEYCFCNWVGSSRMSFRPIFFFFFFFLSCAS